MRDRQLRAKPIALSSDELCPEPQRSSQKNPILLSERFRKSELNLWRLFGRSIFDLKHRCFREVKHARDDV